MAQGNVGWLKRQVTDMDSLRIIDEAHLQPSVRWMSSNHTWIISGRMLVGTRWSCVIVCWEVYSPTSPLPVRRASRNHSHAFAQHIFVAFKGSIIVNDRTLTIIFKMWFANVSLMFSLSQMQVLFLLMLSQFIISGGSHRKIWKFGDSKVF